MICLQLFWEFFKTGLFAVGGGLATLPFLYDMSAKTGWFTQLDLTNMIAVGESTPGPIGVNMATYVGYVTAGIPGGVIATLGLVTPSIIVIMIVAAILKSFRNNRYVSSAFYGLRAASTGLIAASGLSVMAGALLVTEVLQLESVGEMAMKLFNWPAIALAAAVYLLSNKIKWTKKLHPIVFIGISAVVGVVFRFGGV
jgi:chromate transporter